MNRRSFLALCGVAASVGATGCVETVAAPGPDTTSDGEPLYPDDRDVPADRTTHDLYVENFDDQQYDVFVSVRRVTDEELVWEAQYEVPDGRGIFVPDILVENRTYEITVDVGGAESATFRESIESCPHEGGSRNVGAWIESGSVSVRRDICDEIRVGAKLAYSDHEWFMVG